MEKVIEKKLKKVRSILDEDRSQTNIETKVYLSKKQRKRKLREAYLIVDSILKSIQK